MFYAIESPAQETCLRLNSRPKLEKPTLISSIGDLRCPIFPPESYTALEKFYGDSDKSLEVPQLLEMLSQEAAWSVLATASRQVLTLHLLPMLSRIAEYQDWNQMTAANLALCFAPIMICGPDPIQDYKISGIVRRLLEAMIRHWKDDIAPAFNTDNVKFEDSLRLPESAEDREDPLEESDRVRPSSDAQVSGILLLDNEDDSGEEIESRPPLPPRPQQLPSSLEDSTTARRKPAPRLQTPPHYSTLAGSSSSMSADQYLNNVPLEADLEDDDDMEELPDLPAYHTTSTQQTMSPPPTSPPPLIPRKPLPKSDNST